MKTRLSTFPACAVLLFTVSSLAGQGPKVFISADMEGLAGVVTGEQLGPSGFEYQRFRQFMTREVLAAIDGARAAGAREILVADSHGNGQNLLIEELPDDVQLVRAWPRPHGMMQGLDETFDGAVFIGYHSSTANSRGVRAHTLSSARLTDVRINGKSMSEAGLNAALAGQFGVPVIFISGDDAIVEEATAVLGDLETAIVKWAYGFHSARTMTPQAAADLIREKVEKAVARIGDFKPHQVQNPVQLQVQFKNYRASEILAYLPIVERIDSHAIRFVAKDMEEAFKFLQFIGHYEPGVEP